jgi:hypothetical protein
MGETDAELIEPVLPGYLHRDLIGVRRISCDIAPWGLGAAHARMDIDARAWGATKG